MRRPLVGAILLVTLFGCSGREETRAPNAPAGGPAVPPLDAAKVPADLRDLVPLAQRWGIGDDVERSERVEKATEAERSELRAAFGPRQARITGWLNSFAQGVMPDEAAAFMYAQLAIEEMPAR